MIKKTALYFLFWCLSISLAPAWAGSGSDCIYEQSGVDVQQFKKSRHVIGFEKLETNTGYMGALKGIGGFHLQLFSCAHYGATLTVLLGPHPMAETVTKTFDALPALLFPAVDVARVKAALKQLPLNALYTPQHLEPLAAKVGMTDISVQIINAGGMGVLVFGFYGG
ncbi:hypothetical protein NQT62_04610 [Limnobacter humi]|uniref:Uncharacterized protein n=1 Tax=Limnobacter humi TaxID=1778671 RepID=A0ABT1WEB3_9BURK|nr:hypothetical protein [Limnobacter humi]MCQ8895724.1 hypothetical protein [Limnobacter humi]